MNFRKIFRYSLDEATECLKNTQYKTLDVICDIIGKEAMWPEQMTNFDNFFSKNEMNKVFKMKLIIIKP